MSLWAGCQKSWVTTRHTTSGWLCEGRTGAALELQPCTFSAGVPPRETGQMQVSRGCPGWGAHAVGEARAESLVSSCRVQYCARPRRALEKQGMGGLGLRGPMVTSRGEEMVSGEVVLWDCSFSWCLSSQTVGRSTESCGNMEEEGCIREGGCIQVEA